MATSAAVTSGLRAMRANSHWVAKALGGASAAPSSSVARYGKVQGNVGKYDVCVIGGGIVGVTTAWYLKKAGKKVALVEARSMGLGTTGSSTAKVTSNQNVIYTMLAKMHGEETARKYGQMQEEALNSLEAIVSECKLEVELERRAHITWTEEEKKVETLMQEAELAKKFGLPATFIAKPGPPELPASLNVQAAVRYDRQIQFNSFKFCQQLAQKIDGDGCKVFELSRVEQVSSSPVHTVTCAEGTVDADYVVMATHLPLWDRTGHFTLFTASRTQCIAVRTEKPLHDMYIRAEEPMRSLRSTGENDHILIIAGEAFEQGNETETDKRYETLLDWAKQHFGVKEILNKWSAMDYIPSDHLPYIGALHRGTSSIFTATGFFKWGLSNGVAAGAIIRDAILGRENVYATMVDARRWDVRSIPGVIAEGTQTATHMIVDKVKALVAPDISTLVNGRGGIVKHKGETVGAYKDEQGNVQLVKPICTHLGCHLVFNQGDKCWDCPCHGSQFGTDGEVLHGPACFNLPKVEW